MSGSPYGYRYRQERKRLLAGDPLCVWGCGRPATTADHIPPVSAFPAGQWQGRLVPACEKCNKGRRVMRVGRRLSSTSPDNLRRLRKWL